MRKIYKTALPAFLACQALAILAADSKVYFLEDFKQYRDSAPTCVEGIGITIGNDPVWTQSADANCSLTKDSFIFRDFVSLKGAKNVEALFKFRLQAGNPKATPPTEDSTFKLVFRDDKNKELAVIFTTVGVSVDSKDFKVNASANYAEPLPANKWRMASVSVKDGVLKVFVDSNREYKKVIETKVPAISFAGANFFGFEKKPFVLAEIQMREPGALPDTSIARLLSVTRKAEAGKPGPIQQSFQIADSFGATVVTGSGKDAVKFTLAFDPASIPEQVDPKTKKVLPKNSTVTFNLNANAISGNRKVKKDGKDVNEKFSIVEDAYISFGTGQVSFYVRPLLRRYHTSYSQTDVYHDIIRDQAMLPKASEHPLKVEFRPTSEGLDLYLDGSYAKSFPGKLQSANIELAAGASLVNTFSQKNQYDADKFTPLDIALQGMAKTAADAKVSVKEGFGTVEGIPMTVANGAGSADIGLCKEGQGNWALEVDEYLARSPFDGLLTEVHFTVPAAPYGKAYVLCAVDPDPAKDPILTTRIAQYLENGVGVNRLADTLTVFPRGNEKAADNMKKVGTVTMKGKDVPLYLVEIPLNTGKIIDLAMGKNPKLPKHLNFEFFGKPWENFEQIDNSCKPDPNSTSAVQVFGVTLEKSPVGFDFEQAQSSNVFAGGEKPETTVVLKSFAPAKGSVSWTIFNDKGEKAGSKSESFSFAKAGEEKKIKADLSVSKPGWYEIKFNITNAEGKTVFTHDATMAVLAKDERKAGSESPYGVWWFDGAHLTPSDLSFAGPVMFKAGIRQVSWTGKPESELKEWKLTKDQINMPFTMKDADAIAKDPAAKEKIFEKAKKTVDDLLKKFPSAREVVVFHESGPGNDIPSEVVGIKPTLTPERIAREKRYADTLNLAGEFFRKYYPNLKLVVGNTSSSASCIAALLRHGGKVEYIDYIGIETPAQVYVPEKFQEWALQGFRMSMDTAKTLSGKDIPATGCYEFTYRCERDMGEHQQAEWYARDLLISLAGNFTRIGPGILYDTSNSYHNGLWGGSGLLRREPYGYPKKSYVAYAVLTNALDQVKFKRQIPTGSGSVYAIEFDRADGKKAYAFWASRGESKLSVELDGNGKGKTVEMYGESKDFSGSKLEVTASTSPSYMISDKPVKSLSIASRTFAKDAEKAKHAKVAAKLDKADDVQVVKDPSLNTKMDGVFSFQSPIRQEGVVSVASANDKEKGACIEVKLDKSKTPNLNKYITEYAYLKLKNPAPMEGDPAAVGVWVKGNSNWGRVMFELEDADGEIWRSVATGGWGCDVLDWPGNISVNFDGWNFIALPIRDTKLFNDHSPGPVKEQWVSGGGNKKMDLPLKLRGFIVEMNRKPLELIEFKEVANPSVMLKDAGGLYE